MRDDVGKLMEQARSEHYTKIIEENDNNQRKLFKMVSPLPSRASEEKYPPHTNPSRLANEFGNFFVQKIQKIRARLDHLENPSGNMRESQSAYSGSLFTNFQPVSAETIKRIVLSTASKSCENDPIPTQIVKDCISKLLPAITCMVNQSLNEGHLSDTWKEALVRPKLKKRA